MTQDTPEAFVLAERVKHVESVFAAGDGLSKFSTSVSDYVHPIVERYKPEIVASAPWALRGPLKLVWPWISQKLLPIVVRMAIEAVLAKYGGVITMVINAIMPHVKDVLADHVVSDLERLRHVAATTEIKFRA